MTRPSRGLWESMAFRRKNARFVRPIRFNRSLTDMFADSLTVSTCNPYHLPSRPDTPRAEFIANRKVYPTPGSLQVRWRPAIGRLHGYNRQSPQTRHPVI